MKELTVKPNTKLIVCDEIKETLLKHLYLSPFNLNRNKLEKAIKKLFVFGHVELPEWKTFSKYWARYYLKIDNSFYNPVDEYIFVNLDSLDIKTSDNCTFYSHIDLNDIKKILKLVVYELIKYVIINNIGVTRSYVRQKVISFLYQIWSRVITSDLVMNVCESHYRLSNDLYDNFLDRTSSIVNAAIFKRFLNVLKQFRNNKLYLLNEELYNELLIILDTIIKPEPIHDDIQISPELEEILINAYIEVFDDVPENGLCLQCLVYTPNLLANSIYVNNARTKIIIGKLLNYYV